ncbi:DUF1439 domain-containing protein [Roseateles sp.]|uniref:DUF1439 domain-containing protein n=1 Tax=Roseateles sp. TaxID=1971397 RepID=UPI003262FAFC
MLKRRLIVIALLIVVAIPVAWWAVQTFSPEMAIELSREEIQAQLDPKFPAEKCLLRVVCFELREPKLRLDEGSDRVGLTAQFTATLGKRTMPGTVAFTGKPRYVPDTGSFYLDDVAVSEFRMSGNAPDFDEVVRARGPKVMEAILRNVPLYTLKTDTTRGGLAKLALRSVQVVGGKLRITFLNPLGWFS